MFEQSLYNQPEPEQPDPAQPRHADRDEGQGKDHEVVAEAVPELDPALAEVHEVHEHDRQHREVRASDQS